MSLRAQGAELFEESDSGAQDDAANTRAGDARIGQSQCPHCGDWFDNRGIGAHESACDGDCDELEEAGDGEALPDTVERRLEIASVATAKLSDRGAMTEATEQWEASHEKGLFDGTSYTPKGSDNRATAAAKAVIRQRHGYDREAFTKVFGPCGADGCDNGANGYGALFCAACTDMSDDSGESAAKAPDSGGVEPADGATSATIEVGGATVEVEGSPGEVAETVARITGE